MSTPYTIEEGNGRITVRLHGRIDERESTALAQAVGEHLSGSSARGVLFDLEGVDEATLLARANLVEMQRRLGERGVRTVWFSTRPRFRGFALVICHASGDGAATVVSNPDQTDAWFTSSTDRIRDAHRDVDEGLRRIRQRRKGKDT